MTQHLGLCILKKTVVKNNNNNGCVVENGKQNMIFLCALECMFFLMVFSYLFICFKPLLALHSIPCQEYMP